MKLNLDDKIVLITGGSRGIGKAIVETLAKIGAKVYFFYRTESHTTEDFISSCLAHHLKVQGLQVDVRDQDAIDAAVATIVDKEQTIDILINNSGIVKDGLLASFEANDIKDVIDTNIVGLMQVTKAVVPIMMRARKGKIINMSSVSAEKGGRGQTNYAASKGAVNAFTKSLAVELAKRNITVNAVAPGVIETEMSQDVRDLAGEQVLNDILLKRYGKPEEVANVVAFLASTYADYINGEIIHVDGGFKMA